MIKRKRTNVWNYQFGIFMLSVLANFYVYQRYLNNINGQFENTFDPPQDFFPSDVKREIIESNNLYDTHSTGISAAFEPNDTGSWANCTKQTDSERKKLRSNHPDDKTTIVSCHTIHYRSKKSSFDQAEDIIIGVLSEASGKGPERRSIIRDTWAKDQPGIFFLVAGPWNSIAAEYENHGDLIWIDKEEIYKGEQSVLTFKTQSFVNIVNDMATELNLKVHYAFKTDDDSYVNVEALNYHLLKGNHEKLRDYWGWCQKNKFPPQRKETAKWPISYQLYPEPMFPRYCQGAGFALSWKFIKCASDNEHIPKIRFMPLEDVSVGLIAERCNISPVMIEKRSWINLFRTELKEEKERVRDGLAKIDRSKLSKPAMTDRVVQHRIYDNLDMIDHHKAVLGLSKNVKLLRRHVPIKARKEVVRGKRIKYWMNKKKKSKFKNNRFKNNKSANTKTRNVKVIDTKKKRQKKKGTVSNAKVKNSELRNRKAGNNNMQNRHDESYHKVQKL